MVYRAGFAVESNEYHVVYERHSEDSDEDARGPYEMHFTPKDGHTAGAQLRDWLAADHEIVVIDKEHIVHYEPVENALEAVRTQLHSIEKECREYFGVEQFSRTTILLSGPGNYRDRIATVAPYKGNRDPDHKPHWYQQIRNYLTSEWGARVVTGREADDECSIIGWQHIHQGDPDGYVIATIDKDLDQIPGWHYNYHKQVFYKQSADDAERFFWEQCLSGDATDGIPGCTKVGTVGAKRLIDDWIVAASRDKPRDRQSVQEYIWAQIVYEYSKSRDKKGCPYVGRDPAAVALEMARLVYLQHHEGELWVPPGEPKELLEDYIDG